MKLKGKKTTLKIIILMLFFIIPTILQFQKNIPLISAHSRDAYPTMIHSLWNDTNPIIDGSINFNSTNVNSEWSAAAVYWMVDNDDTAEAKLFVQNDNTDLYVAVDALNQQSFDPSSPWGTVIYLDRNHDGLLSSYDRAISLFVNSSGSYVIYYQYSPVAINGITWEEIEDGTPGTPLTISDITADVNYASSYFETNDHYQYEFRIPKSIVNVGTGNITGFAVETFTNYNEKTNAVTWPYLGSEANSDLTVIRTKASYWGDLVLASSLTSYEKYVFEENTNIKSDAIGTDSAIFLATGDIDGDGHKEIITSSMSTNGDIDYLVAIYDYEEGEYIRKWASWQSTHKSDFTFVIEGIVAYDFDEDSKDEVYLVGKNPQIIQLRYWNDGINDFDELNTVFTNSYNLMGYLEIGYADNEGDMNLVTGDRVGNIIILDYDDTNIFEHDKRSPFRPSIALFYPNDGIHGVEAADMDNDGITEIITWLQASSDDSVAPTAINIFQRNPNSIGRNDEDDIPFYGASETFDYFGHSIVVDDVDNDGTVETIIVGQDLLRIYGAYTFTDIPPPLEFIVNDGTSTVDMAGGVTVADIDDDSYKELIFGCNNGTLFIMNITDSGSDNLSYNIEWQMDVGSAPGYHEAMTVLDFDQDGEKELILGDYFGQIMVIGKSAPPELVITSPSEGQSVSTNSITVEWTATDDFIMHHFDIYLNSVWQGRAGGGQTGYTLAVESGTNFIEVIGYDITNKVASDNVTISKTLLGPVITVTSPDNFYTTASESVLIDYQVFDGDGNFDYAEYRINEGSPIYLSDQQSYTFLVSLSPGENNITITAYDDFANSGRTSIFIIRDNDAPELTINSPNNGFVTRLGSVDIEWSASDELSGIDYFDVYLDETYYSSTFATSTTINFGLDKEYTIDIIAYDQVGNDRTRSITVTKDSIKPNTLITNPISDITTSSTSFDLSWEANDNFGGSGIERSEVFVNNQKKYSGSNTNYDILFATEGVFDVSVRTFDFAGNSDFDVVRITVDYSVPNIQIISPVNNYNTSMTNATVFWESDDAGSGIKEYQVIVDGVVEATITDIETTHYFVEFTTEKAYNITILVIDNYDLENSHTVFINYDASFGLIEFTTPIEPTYYTNNEAIYLTWRINGIEQLTGFAIYRNGSLNQTLSTGFRNTTLNLPILGENERPLYNITIVAISLVENQSAMKWIIVDKSEPLLVINSPTNGTSHVTQSLLLTWSYWDQGYEVDKIEFYRNGSLVLICCKGATSYYVPFNGDTGWQQLKIVVYDFAGNNASEEVTVEIIYALPQLDFNVSESIYTQTGNFTFDLSVLDTGLGIKRLTLFMDTVDQQCYNFANEIFTSPFVKTLNINQSSYQVPTGTHVLNIIAIDIYDQETIRQITIYIDTTAPTINGFPSFGTNSWSSPTISVSKSNDPTENNFTVFINIEDTIKINSVVLEITGPEFSDIIIMTPSPGNTDTDGLFTATIDINNLELGSYSFSFIITDAAGNSYEQTYTLNLIPAQGGGWLTQGYNLYYFIGGIVLLFILSLFMTIGIRRVIQNANWQENILSVSYILNGIPCVFVQKSSRANKDDLLFSGAMTGIKGILDELAGSEGTSKRHIETVDVGNQVVIIKPGDYGYAVILVEQAKPIYERLISNFTEEFEKKYRHILKTGLVYNQDGFTDATDLVQKHFKFGKIRFKPQVSQLLRDSQQTQPEQQGATTEQSVEYYQQPTYDHKVETIIDEKSKIALEDIMANVSAKCQKIILEVVELIPRAISSLFERDYTNAQNIYLRLNIILEEMYKHEEEYDSLNQFIYLVYNINTELFNALTAAKNGDEFGYREAAEKVSNIWLQQMGS